MNPPPPRALRAATPPPRRIARRGACCRHARCTLARPTHAWAEGSHARGAGLPPYTTPVFNFELNPYLRLAVPADDRTDVVTGGTDNATFAYQPEHIVGNIFSYPWYSINKSQGQTIAQVRFAPRTNGFNRAGVQLTFPNTTFSQYSVGTTNATYQVQFDSSANSSDSYSTTSTNTETSDITVSAEVEASGSFFSGLVGVSGSVSATGSYSTEAMQSFSQMSTRSLSSSVQNQYT